jgi:hypothetical protein
MLRSGGNGSIKFQSWQRPRLHPDLFTDFVLAGLPPQAKKKPAWPNTRRYSATPAYSLTNPPG